jgi:polysaccharide pyruvyl transferase CsaB
VKDRPASALRVLLCGYYGEHNLGDDALLEVLLDQLPRGCIPVVTARDREAVTSRFGVASVDRTRLRLVVAALAGCDALVLGGGSLLQDATSFTSLLYYVALILLARMQGKPVILWGQGLGPLRRRRSRLIARRALRSASAVSFRDPASAAMAAGWGIEGLLGSDPVWALPPGRWRGQGGPIVVCWRPLARLGEKEWRALLGALAELAAAAERRVLWLPFHRRQDPGLLEHLKESGWLPPELAARSREESAETPRQAMDLFERSGLVVAMRLHGLILAALAGAPCAAISYDPKVAAAAAALGCPSLDPAAAGDSPPLPDWRRCLDHPPDPAAIGRLREQSQLHRRLLAGLAPPAG